MARNVAGIGAEPVEQFKAGDLDIAQSATRIR